MNLSKKWMSDYVTLYVTDKQFADGMTISGSKVEGFEKEGEEIKNVVVGRVDSLEKHPDSDHLWICQINVGTPEDIQIVTGAQNLKVGDIVPVAMDNSYVVGGHHIKKGKLRGVESNGMLCSLGELGLTIHDFPYAVEDGIFVLGDDCDLTLRISTRLSVLMMLLQSLKSLLTEPTVFQLSVLQEKLPQPLTQSLTFPHPRLKALTAM